MRRRVFSRETGTVSRPGELGCVGFASCFTCDSGKIAGSRLGARRQSSHRQSTRHRCATYLVSWRGAARLVCMFWRGAGTREAGRWQGSPLACMQVCVLCTRTQSISWTPPSIDAESWMLFSGSHSCYYIRQALIPHDGPRCEQGSRPTQGNVAAGSPSASSSTSGGYVQRPVSCGALEWCARVVPTKRARRLNGAIPPVAPGNGRQHTLLPAPPQFPSVRHYAGSSSPPGSSSLISLARSLVTSVRFPLSF